MSSIQAQLAQAVTDQLNSAEAGLDLANPAIFAWQKVWTQAELATMRLTVLPGGMSWARETREAYRNGLQVTVMIQKRLGLPENETEDIDAVVQVVEKIADHLAANYQPIPGCMLETVETVPIPDEEQLVNQRTITCLVGVTYRAMRTIA
jgi:hypothetical protein